MLKQKLDNALEALEKIPKSMITVRMHAIVDDLLQELERVRREEFKAIRAYKKKKKKMAAHD